MSSNSDADFDTLQKTFVGPVAAAPDQYGITAAEAATLQADQAAWNASYPAHTKAKTDLDVAAKAKKSDRNKLSKDISDARKKVNGTATVTDAARAKIGMGPHDAVRTSVSAPVTTALGRAVANGHLGLTLHIADALTPEKAARPPGTLGYEIWRHIGDPQPGDPSAYTFVRTATRTPYNDAFSAADAGKTVYYQFRWVGTKGDPGPWGDVVSAKIPV